MMNQSSDAPAIPMALMSEKERSQVYAAPSDVSPTTATKDPPDKWEDMGDNPLDQIKDVVQVSARYYPVEMLQKAYTLYLHSAAGPVDIAIKLGVPSAAVASWITAGNWAARKREIEAVLTAEADAKYRQFLIDNRLPEAQTHLKLARELQDALERTVTEGSKEGPLNPVSLERLAKALAAMTGVSARAVGISSETSALDSHLQEEQRRREAGGGKPPLLIIGVSGNALIQVPPGAAASANLPAPSTPPGS